MGKEINIECDKCYNGIIETDNGYSETCYKCLGSGTTKAAIEVIKCPECGVIQEAIVEQSIPFWIYIHECVKCGYTIMESDWEQV